MMSALLAEDVLSVILESENPYYRSSLVALPTDDPRRAVSHYNGLRSRFALGPGKKELRNALIVELLKNPKVPHYIESRLEEIPQSHIHGHGRRYLFDILGDIRTEWSVRLLGKHLMDETVVTDSGYTQEEIREWMIKKGRKESPNHVYAAWAIARMELKNAPTKPPVGYGSQRGAVAKWRPWWEANKHDIAATLVAEDPLEPVDDPSKAEERGRGSEPPELAARKKLSPPEVSEESPREKNFFVWVAAAVFFLAVAFYRYKKWKRA